MGNTTPKPQIHEDVIRVINANVQQSAHLEKTAGATSVLAVVGVLLLVILVIYVIYRAVVKYERLSTQSRIERAVSLANIVVSK